MATKTQILSAAAALLAAAFAVHPATHGAVSPVHEALDADEIELMGNAGHAPDSTKPKVTAFFRSESYHPGDHARLVVTDTAAAVSVQIMRAGGEPELTLAHDVMLGTPVTRPAAIGAVHGRKAVDIPIGTWPS